jgi:predicted transcriptional regulator of viral defense system
MALATNIRKQIEQFPKGMTFGYAQLRIEKAQYSTAAKALERLQKEGVIKKVSKGVFYKPELTAFGELQPDYNELLRPYLFANGKRVAYETGTSLYNRLGLTSQLAFRIKIASRSKRIAIDRGSLVADSVKSYSEVTNTNFELLGILDAFKDIKRIPDCSTQRAVRRLSAITKDLNEKQIESLLKYALAYPPRVRALAGAVLEQNGINTKGIQKLKDSLNPFTTFEFGLKEKDLPNKSNWHIA